MFTSPPPLPLSSLHHVIALAASPISSKEGTTGHMSTSADPSLSGDAGKDGASDLVVQPVPAVPRVAELAGETASPPPAFTAIINIKCPDQTGVVRKRTVIYGV